MLHNKKHTLIAIIGPTAIGKTALSIKLAKHFGTEIISADSRQFFQELEIGTAKPSKEEQEGVPHHLIDNISIHEKYTAGDFERDALTILDKVFSINDTAIVVGGSGLYVNALLKGIDDIPKDENIRKELSLKLETKGIESLQKMIKELDSVFASEMNINNPQRLIRAIEACMASGKTYSSLRKNAVKDRPFNIIKIGLTAPRELLYERINKRVNIMIDNGLIKEAQSVYEFKHLNSLNTVGYKELFNYFNNVSSI